MPKMRRKADLPQKICASCGRPFDWRKKWERVWEEVRYCSDRCRNERNAQKGKNTDPKGDAEPREGFHKRK